MKKKMIALTRDDQFILERKKRKVFLQIICFFRFVFGEACATLIIDIDCMVSRFAPDAKVVTPAGTVIGFEDVFLRLQR